MSGYQVSSAAATQLPRFCSANKSTTESGLSAQNAAVTAASTRTVANNAVSQSFSTLGQQPQAATTAPILAPAAGNNAFRLLDGIQGINTGFSAPYNMEQFVSGIIGAENNLGVLAKPGAAVAQVATALETPALPGAGLAGGLGNVTATLSRAGSIGPMSVPASWSAPTSAHISPLEPAGFTILPGTEEPVTSGYPGYPGMPGGAASRSVGVGAPPRYGVRPTVIPRPPAAG